ncbi:MAG TPA: trimethylamine methyltransferase family protein [Planctomycetota bacterium]|nr:trimethylamine methyltransferase family protein [Planctomycetota bacterium]
MLQKTLLRDSDVERLADGVVAVLERVGILCQNGELLRALDAAGAKVDFASQRAHFPRKMQLGFVEQFRKDVGRAYLHAERPWQAEEAQAAPFASIGVPDLETQVAQFVHDPETGERRSGNTADFVRLIQLGDALHREVGVGHCLLLTDVPPLVEPLEAALLLAEHAHKPHAAFAWNVRQVPYLAEMGEILGYKSWFNYGAICFAHPLRFDRDVADRFVHKVRAGSPTGLTAMPVAGVTAPVTLAGFVAVAAAEHLATWIAARALNPAVRLGGSMWGGTVDMRGSGVSYCSFDAMLYSFATVEFLWRWCGIRVPVGGGEYCDAKEPGLYAALEKAYKAMTIAAFSGRHPGIGSGLLDEGKVISPVQLLIERDFTLGARHFARAVEVTPELLALEEIAAVGLGLDTSHLGTDHTLRHFRDSLWLPALLERSGWAGAEYEAKILAKAKAQLNELRAAYRKPEVDPDNLAKMRAIIEKARRELL